jgi:hypothetical protein
MLRISIVELRKERRLELEGKLIAPWTTELRSVCKQAGENLEGRQLVVSLNNLTDISQQGQDLIAVLMSEGIKFRGRGVFAKEVLRQVGLQGAVSASRAVCSPMS